MSRSSQAIQSLLEESHADGDKIGKLKEAFTLTDLMVWGRKKTAHLVPSLRIDKPKRRAGRNKFPSIDYRVISYRFCVRCNTISPFGYNPNKHHSYCVICGGWIARNPERIGHD